MRRFFATLDAALCAIGRWLIQPLGTRIAVVTLLSIHAGLLAYSATRHSPTHLEPGLLVAGLSHWKFGRFEMYRVNPPLVRMVAALPVMAAGYHMDWGGFYDFPGARPEFAMGTDFIELNGNRSIWLITIARWACLPFSLAGALFAYMYSREIWRSDAAGLLTLAIWCFEPNILAHAELITNDVACTSLGLGAMWLFWRWLCRPQWGRAVAAGVLLGLAELSKSSWLILFGLWPVLTVLWCLTDVSFVALTTEPAGGVRRYAASQAIRSNTAMADVVPPHFTYNVSRLLGRVVMIPQLASILITAVCVLNIGYGMSQSPTRLAAC